MASNDYHFITQWRVQGTLKEVTDIIGDADGLVRWWPAVYLDAKTLQAGDERGLGKQVALYTKGWLPYTLRWYFIVTDIRDNGFTLEAHGDFEGRGIWTFTRDGDWVNAIYDWKLSAEKPLLRYFSLLMKPLFSANHHWAMARGEESLKLELMRRRASSVEEQRAIPGPPQATTTSTLPLMMGTIALLASLFGLCYLSIKAVSKQARK